MLSYVLSTLKWPVTKETQRVVFVSEWCLRVGHLGATEDVIKDTSLVRTPAYSLGRPILNARFWAKIPT